MDAVMTVAQGRCVAIYFVPRGKTVTGYPRQLVLLQCKEGPIPEMVWISEDPLQITGFWQGTNRSEVSNLVEDGLKTAILEVQ